jgi:hypothetical protein
MTPQIFHDPAPALSAAFGRLPQQPRLFALVIPPIVPRVRPRETVSAPRLQPRLASSDRRKLIIRLHLAAFRARSHEGERAVMAGSCEWDDWSVLRYYS